MYMPRDTGHRAAHVTGGAPETQGMPAALEALPHEKAAEAKAAATVLLVASWLRAAAIPRGLLSTPLLLHGVDDADPRTMAARLSAHVSNVSELGRSALELLGVARCQLTLTMLVDALKGSETKAMRQKGLPELPGFKGGAQFASQSSAAASSMASGGRAGKLATRC